MQLNQFAEDRRGENRPNYPLRQTGAAIRFLLRFWFSERLLLLSFVDYEAVGEVKPFACFSGICSPAHPFTPS
jgi:hypothetical protein